MGPIEMFVNATCFLVLMIIELIIYLILVGTVLPKWFMKVRCSVTESRDRGMKKYIFPEGRGVAYEPHPSVRKYIHRYVLFVSEGYKYIKCRLDDGITHLNYTVVMFNNRNKVIDVIDVSERRPRNAETGAVQIHQDTSYVALIPNTVNGERLHAKKIMYRRVSDICLYAAFISVLSFIEMNFIAIAALVASKWLFNFALVINLSFLDLVLPSVIIGGIAVASLWLHDRIKGVRWGK